MRCAFRVREGMVFGERLRYIELVGNWVAEVSEAYDQHECRGLEWRIPRRGDKDADLLKDLADLRYLQLWAGPGFDDSAVAGLREVKYLGLYTRAGNPLDLSRLTPAEWLEVDYRPGLSMPAAASLRRVSVACFSGGRLSQIMQGVPLHELKVEGTKGSPPLELDVFAEQLTSLRVVDLSVTSLQGFRAPHLQELHLLTSANTRELDLSPLRHCLELRRLHLRGPKSVRGLNVLLGLPKLEKVALIGVALDSDEARAIQALERF